MTVENLEIKVKATGVTAAANRLISLSDAMDRVQGAASSVSGSAGTQAAKSVEKVGKAAEKATKPMNNFLSSLKRIAFYRVIRGIIKSITQAFTEGLEKAYLFSAAASDVMDRRFAAAMDSMKSSANAMKVQLGSAFIALLTALQPIIETLINLVIKLADAISQFFAAFTGNTYVKASKVAAQFADTMGRGGAAAKEWKNQLLGFDEINRLNEPNQGGGGGGTNPLQGFGGELAPINEKLLEFIDRIKNGLQPAIDRVKEAFDRLKEAWDRFKESLSQDGALKNLVTDLLVLGGDLVLNGITLVTDTLTLLLNVLTALQTGDWTPVWESLTKAFQDVWQAVYDFVWDGLIVLADAIDALIPGEQNLADKLRAIKDGTYKATIQLEDGTEAIYTMADAAADASGKLNGTLKPSLEQNQTAVKNLKDDFRLFSNDVSAFITSLFQPLADLCGWIDSVLTGFGLMKGINARVAQSTADGSIYLQGFASGGFPQEGQLFFANEGSAPEMVGTMGGRTAVATNGDIVEGIRQGVYEAVVAGNNNNGGDVQVRVYLDSREIKAGQQRLNRAWGV
jgi:hypothetical protein